MLLLLALACGGDPAPAPNTDDAPPPSGEGVFAEGCPVEGQALARRIGVDASLPGEVAVGTRGDLLLANQHAAFVVTDALEQSTYWYYGGALADAVPMEECVPGTDRLDDLGLVLAEFDLLAIEQAVVRAFRADTVEVVSDGSDGGPAHVRASGTDDTHWLVEHTLINEAAGDGGRPPSGPLGLDVTVDYILPPDSAVLEVHLSIENIGERERQLIDASLSSWDPTMVQHAYASTPIELGGFGLAAGIPWVSVTNGETAYVLSRPMASLAAISIAGVNVVADMNSLVDPRFVVPPGGTSTRTLYVTATSGPGSSGVVPTLATNSQPTMTAPPTARTITATVREPSGAPAQSSVRVEARAPGSEWGPWDRAPTDVDGTVRLSLPDFETPWEWRLLVDDDARDPSEPVEVTPGQSVSLDAEPTGALDVQITDSTGAPSPARLHLVRADGAVETRWVTTEPSIPLPPGTWSWTATRGYEYAPARGEVVVPPGGSAPLVAELWHVVDTTGWVSVDTHVHTSDSPDSNIHPTDQLAHAAAHGLDVVIHTEHENLVDRSTLASTEGIDDWVVGVGGEEVTSVAIEHMTMFPATTDGSPRGGYVEWYGLDIAELFAAMRQRSGGGVNLVNHPGYLDRIGWDRVRAAPTLDDPSLLGLDPGAALWSWDLDGLEVMNGHSNPFIDGNRRFDNWMSMVNAGHQVVGVGCSDDHYGNEVGFPRSYVPSPTDAPADVDPLDLRDAFQDGALQASAGGFARVSIDGVGPGGTTQTTDGRVTLDVQLEALPEVDITHFVVLASCDEVESVRVEDPDGVVKHAGSVPLVVDSDSAIVVAAFGSTNLPAGLPQYNAARVPRVLTSPIYVDADGDGEYGGAAGRECSYDLSLDAAD